jgi:hypothetical protein
MRSLYAIGRIPYLIQMRAGPIRNIGVAVANQTQISMNDVECAAAELERRITPSAPIRPTLQFLHILAMQANSAASGSAGRCREVEAAEFVTLDPILT